jgi:membrane associated rhomboid family serine protease
MGIQNREYVRGGSRTGSFEAAIQAPAVLTRLIGVTVVVYVFQLLLNSRAEGSVFTNWLQLTSDDLYFRGQVWRLLTYAFVHSVQSPLHLLFNMMTLYAVGRMVTNPLGGREFLWFYLTSAVFAGMCSVVFYTLIGQQPSIIGASGAVYAVFGIAAMYYPRQKVYLFGALPVEMRWLLAGFVVMDALPMLASSSTGVAHSAHLGGLLFGFLYARMSMNLTRGWDRLVGRITTRNRSRSLKIFAPSDTPESSLDHQMDMILAKISRSGEASLTARERNILTQASRQLRKDRGL